MYYKQAFNTSCAHHSRRSHGHRHPFKHFMNHLRSLEDTPPANVEELDDHYTISIYAPGLEKNNFEIQLKDDTLIVRGKPQKDANFDEPFRWQRKEYGAQAFERYFQLNEKIDKNAISAKYEDGVLRIELPKLEGFESHSHSIEVN